MEDRVKELAAIAASVAARCQPCFERHLEKAKALGLPESDIREAIALGEKVGQAGGQRMMDFINERLERFK